MSDNDAGELKPGMEHYAAYVGPPEQYDFMGATQFRLLTTLGLRSSHRLLDFGCGSLRAGRMFIPYLDSGCYFGIEPNKWLVEEGIEKNLGQDIVKIKQPSFAHVEDFSVPFNAKFDFIVAQSIYSHTGLEPFKKGFQSFYDALNEDGIVLATFVVGSSELTEGDWVYPGCVKFNRSTIKQVANELGFVVKALPWYHPARLGMHSPKNVLHYLPEISVDI